MAGKRTARLPGRAVQGLVHYPAGTWHQPTPPIRYRGRGGWAR